MKNYLKNLKNNEIQVAKGIAQACEGNTAKAFTKVVPAFVISFFAGYLLLIFATPLPRNGVVVVSSLMMIALWFKWQLIKRECTKYKKKGSQ